MSSVDKVLSARWVIPVDPSNSVLEEHSIAINKNRIHAVMPTKAARELFDTAEFIDLPNHAVIPGFVNAHTHAAMSLLRGVAEDLPLETWLQNYIWPLEQKWVSEDFVRAGTRLAFAEMIQSGTTCMNDMYFFPNVVGELAAKTGLRASLGMIVLEFPTIWASSADDYLQKGLEVHREFSSTNLVSTMFAPHAPYTVADAMFEKIASAAAEHSLRIHMHVHETRDEIENSLKMHGVRPIERLNQLGIVTENLIAVHATQLEENEIALFAEAKSSVAHCPKSNLKLSSGTCPAAQLLKNGVNVAIGTDSAASNNSLNMLEEMRFATLLAKNTPAGAANIPVHQALRMATINGARCLGLDADIGSLEAGKLADITALDLSELACLPVYDPVAQLVHAASRNQVTDVWVDGKRLLNNRKLTTIDETECADTAVRWGKKLRKSL